MLHISFAMTSDAYADGSKTETRRFWKPAHAAKFRPGVVFMGITKDFRAGGVRMHPARVLECYRERLGNMSGYSFSAEGGMRYWANRAAYIEMMGGPDNVPWVLRFEHLPNKAGESRDARRLQPNVGIPAFARCRNRSDHDSCEETDGGTTVGTRKRGI